jgi:YVTN family beta-propeller protein
VAYQAEQRRLYVSGRSNTGVEVLFVVDPVSGSVAATIPMGGRVFKFAIAPDGSRLYLPDFDANAVAVVDASELRILRRVAVGVQPFDATVSRAGDVFVANYRDDTVSVIDTKSLEVTRTIGINGRPMAIAAGPDGRVYVATLQGAIVGVAPNSVVPESPISVGWGPTAIIAGRRSATGCFHAGW